MTGVSTEPVSDPRPAVGTHRGRIGTMARRVVRGYGMATSRWRSDPDFIVIGAKRGGTTSFYFDLVAHPDVCPLFPACGLMKREATKGIRFFDSNFWRGERWFRSYLPTRGARRRHSRRHAEGNPVVVGEASPYYLSHPAAAQRVAATLPAVKIIVLLRDPVERAYSHWKERIRSQAETLTFPEAIAAEASRMGDAAAHLAADAGHYSYAHENYSYAAQSMYAEALRPWLEYLPRSQFLFLASEDYYDEPAATMETVETFLGIRHIDRPAGTHRNAAAADELADDVAVDLRRRFAAANTDLVQLVGRDFPWTTR